MCVCVCVCVCNNTNKEVRGTQIIRPEAVISQKEAKGEVRLEGGRNTGAHTMRMREGIRERETETVKQRDREREEGTEEREKQRERNRVRETQRGEGETERETYSSSSSSSSSHDAHKQTNSQQGRHATPTAEPNSHTCIKRGTHLRRHQQRLA